MALINLSLHANGLEIALSRLRVNGDTNLHIRLIMSQL